MMKDVLKLKKLTLSDLGLVKQYITGDVERTCDYTVGGVFIWRDYFDTYFDIIDDTLIMQNTYNGRKTFSIPQGKNPINGYNAIIEYCLRNQLPLVFNTVTQSDLSTLQKLFVCEAMEERSQFDYLYSAQSLSTFKGKKYNTQRNHLNNFFATYSDIQIVPITSENISVLVNFMDFYERENEKASPMYNEELLKVREVLANNNLYGQSGIYILADNHIVAFSMGEVVGDTLYVHIEKALSSVRGAYQMIVKEFVRYELTKNSFLYVNREDDAGDEGMRYSKLAYRPARLIEKYTVTVLDSSFRS